MSESPTGLVDTRTSVSSNMDERQVADPRGPLGGRQLSCWESRASLDEEGMFMM